MKSDAIVQQITQRATLFHISPFVTSHTAAEFAARGYMSEDSTGSTFSAPDADVLLDPSFAATHCFGVRREKARPTQIGLTIRPVKNTDRVVDITGTLWMDTDHPALRSLDFDYTSLDRAAHDAHPGGQISFREMRPGVVFVDRWNIRMAELRLQVPDQSSVPSALRTDRATPHLVHIHESGGEVVTARWSDGITWKNTLGRVSGRVVDAESGKPVPALRVKLALSFDSTTTDSLGKFTFSDLASGPYTVVASDTRLAAFGLGEQQERPTQVSHDSTSSISIPWRSIDSRLRHVCHDEPAIAPADSAKYGTLLGRVVLPDGSAAIGARVDPVVVPDSAAARALQSLGARVSENAQRLDQGVFVLCNVERGATLLIHAAHPRADTADVQVQLGKDEAMREITIHLPASRPRFPSPLTPASSAKRSSPTSPPDQKTHPQPAPSAG